MSHREVDNLGHEAVEHVYRTYCAEKITVGKEVAQAFPASKGAKLTYYIRLSAEEQRDVLELQRSTCKILRVDDGQFSPISEPGSDQDYLQDALF
jgi:hypothetical protein